MIRSRRIRRVLRRGAEHVNDRGWQRLLAGLDAGDAGGHVAAAWIAAHDLRLLYRAPDRTRAAQLLHRLLTHCADAGAARARTAGPHPRRLAR